MADGRCWVFRGIALVNKFTSKVNINLLNNESAAHSSYRCLTIQKATTLIDQGTGLKATSQNAGYHPAGS